jgi:acetyltransferase-like isoleucine patch superfamily enzyme
MSSADHPDASGQPTALDPAARLAEAERRFSEGQIDVAEAQLLELLPLVVGDRSLRSEVLSDLAVISAQRGSWKEAATLASRALDHDPANGSASQTLALCSQLRDRSVRAHSSGVQLARVEEFNRLSSCLRVRGEPTRHQPVLLLGLGQICFGEGVEFGWYESPGFYSHYVYIEAMQQHSHVEIGDRSFLNNGSTLRSIGEGISIGADCLFGWCVQVFDSDFHDLHPTRRRSAVPPSKHVAIGDNVFIGANTIVTKGVSIGDDTVIGAGSVVTASLPAGVIAAGNPARVVRALEDRS